jgi:hypothetical protein
MHSLHELRAGNGYIQLQFRIKLMSVTTVNSSLQRALLHEIVSFVYIIRINLVLLYLT